MKQITIFLLLFILIKSHSQNNKNHTIYLTDGTTLIAKKVNTLNRKHVVVITKEGEKIKIPYNKIYRHLYYQKKTSFSPRNIPNLTEFVVISDEIGDMMSVLVEGKCNLYAGYIPQLRNSGAYGFYVKRKGENIATCIETTNWLEARSYKEIALEYFKDCPKMVQKIQTESKKKEIKKLSRKKKLKKMIELIEFYNNEFN
tara:strand:+ start:73 stop:672 length:600 start_codon:yes stop_codon:yes gene_type:complete